MSDRNKWIDRVNTLHAYGQTLSLMVFVKNEYDPRTVVDDEIIYRREKYEDAEDYKALYRLSLEMLAQVEPVAREYGAPVDEVKRFFYPEGGPEGWPDENDHSPA